MFYPISRVPKPNSAPPPPCHSPPDWGRSEAEKGFRFSIFSKNNNNFLIFLHFAYSFEFDYILIFYSFSESKYLHECLYIFRIFTFKQDLNTSVKVKISRLFCSIISNLILKVFENNPYKVCSLYQNLRIVTESDVFVQITAVLKAFLYFSFNHSNLTKSLHEGIKINLLKKIIILY